MASTVSVDEKTIQTILTRLDKLAKDVRAIKAKLIEEEPTEGSDEWWAKAIKEGEEDLEAGRYTELRTKEELTAFLDSLK